jgi:hypothetical protein
MPAGTMDLIFTGLIDGASPVQMAPAGVLVLLLLFLRKASWGWRSRIALVFTGVLVLFPALFNLSFMLGLDHATWVYGLALVCYAVLGVVFMATGILFFAEWQRLASGEIRPIACFIPCPSRLSAWHIMPGVIGLAVGLDVIALVWPSSNPFVIQTSFLDFLSYELPHMFMTMAVTVLCFWSTDRRVMKYLDGRRSLAAILLAAVFLAAGVVLLHFSWLTARMLWV